MTKLSACGVTVFTVAAWFGCGGDGRPETAPELPVPQTDAPCSELDQMSDGTIDTTYSYTYDRDGFETAYAGVPAPNMGTLEYDADHFLLHYTYDGDTTPALAYEETYTRDRFGRILTSVVSDAFASQGATTESYDYRYDSRGRLSHSTYTLAKTATTETTTADYTYTGDDLQPTSASVTYPQFASAFTYTMSADGRSRHLDIDDHTDGTIDRTEDRTYDSARRVLGIVNRSATAVTSRTAYTYNARGQVVTNAYAATALGMPDDYVTTSTYDSGGMLTQTTVTSPSGQFATAANTETYKQTCANPGTTVARVHRQRLPFARADVVLAP